MLFWLALLGGVATGRWLGGTGGAVLALLGSAIAIGLAPGLALAAALRPLWRPTVIEIVPLSLAGSIVLIQLMTTVSVTTHIPASAMLKALIGAETLAFVLLAALDTRPLRLLRPNGLLPWIGVGGLCLAATLAYIAGGADIAGIDASKLHNGLTEVFTHIAVSWWLSVAPAPASENIFYVQGLTYTYPFPGTHYFYALVSLLSGLDPIYVFDKFRAFWTLCTLAIFYAGMRALLRSRIAADVALPAFIVLLLTGPLGQIKNLFWGQMAPLSHAADVALSVYLPLAILLLLWLMRAANRRARFTFAALLLLLALTLAMVHAREFVQVAIYLLAAVVALLIRGRFANAATIFGVLLLGAVGAQIYQAWVISAAHELADVVSIGSQNVRAHAAQMSPFDWLLPLGRFVWYFEKSAFWGLGGLMLLTAPVAIALYGQSRATVLAAGGIVAGFLPAVVIGGVSIVLLLLTYDEFLVSAIRNVVDFLYLLFGAALFALLSLLCAQRRRWNSGTIVLAATGISIALGITALLIAAIGRQVFWLVVWAALLGTVISLIWILRPRRKEASPPLLSTAALRGSLPALVLPALLLPLSAITAEPSRSLPVMAFRSDVASNPVAERRIIYAKTAAFSLGLTSMPPDIGDKGTCVESVLPEAVRGPKSNIARYCVPSLTVLDALNAAVRPSDVVYMNPVNRFFGVPFLRTRLANLPRPWDVIRDWRLQLPRQVEMFALGRAEGGVGPVFSPHPQALRAFEALRKLRATHVLIDPMFADALLPALKERSDLFKLLLEKDGWALFSVAQDAVK